MFKIKLFFLYIEYIVKSKTKHSVHSPFVFKLISDVIPDKKNSSSPVLKKIEDIRSILLKDNSPIEINDLGAGSNKKTKDGVTVKQIARNALKNKKYAALMHRLVEYFKPATVLELGTSLGITTAYMAFAYPHCKIISVEGSESVADIAQKNIQQLTLTNVEIIKGAFDDKIQEAINKLTTLDFVYIDGNHRKQPTLKYFNYCLPYASDSSVFVFDDIRWSAEMIEAWDEIKKHDSVSVSIDLFFMGIVFVKKQQAKEHFVLRF